MNEAPITGRSVDVTAGVGARRVTVAICTFNRGDLLRQTLRSLTSLGIPPCTSWDVLVVNNDCTDATDAVVAEFASMLPVRVVHEPAPGLSNARNRALQECRGEYLVFTDDDVQVGATWLTALVNAIAVHPDGAVFGGPVIPWFPREPEPALLSAFPVLRRGFCGIDYSRTLGPLPSDLQVVGANLAFRVAALDGLRFDPRLGVNGTSLGGHEETAIVEAIRARGGDVIWVPDMKVRHYVDPDRMRIGYLIRFSRDRGRTLIREKGLPAGRRIAGAPAWLWARLLRASVAAAVACVQGKPLMAAGHVARCANYHAKIAECRALARSASFEPEGTSCRRMSH